MLILFSCYSGERISAKEWPSSIEIKGRVRLDAFEKFLQELPLSRSRAVMVSSVTFHCIAVSFYAKFIKIKKSLTTRLGFLSLSPHLVIALCSRIQYTNDICFRVMRPLSHLVRGIINLKEKKNPFLDE